MSELDPLDVHVGSALRTLRMQRELTLEGLASKLGVTYQQVQKYETGRNRISAATLYRISCIMKVSPAIFFPSPKNDGSAEAGLQTEYIATARAIDKIEAQSVRKSLRALVDSLGKTQAA